MSDNVTFELDGGTVEAAPTEDAMREEIACLPVQFVGVEVLDAAAAQEGDACPKLIP